MRWKILNSAAEPFCAGKNPSPDVARVTELRPVIRSRQAGSCEGWGRAEGERWEKKRGTREIGWRRASSPAFGMRGCVAVINNGRKASKRSTSFSPFGRKGTSRLTSTGVGRRCGRRNRKCPSQQHRRSTGCNFRFHVSLSFDCPDCCFGDLDGELIRACGDITQRSRGPMPKAFLSFFAFAPFFFARSSLGAVVWLDRSLLDGKPISHVVKITFTIKDVVLVRATEQFPTTRLGQK